MMGGFGFGAFGGMWMALGMVAGVAVLVWLVWGAFRLTEAGHQQYRPEESALDILKKRYAAGEISQAEFEVAKKGLA